MTVPYIKPLDPANIPAGHFAVWNSETEEWNYPEVPLPPVVDMTIES